MAQRILTHHNGLYRATWKWETHHRDWVKRNPDCDLYYEKARHYSEAYRVRQLGLEAKLTLEEWLDLLEAYDHCCKYCGIRLVGSLTMDHVIPLARKGEHTKENVVPACWPCNISKSVYANPRVNQRWRVKRIRLMRAP